MDRVAKWMIHAKKADFDGLGRQFQISPILARIIRNRGLEKPEEFDSYLNGGIDQLHSPFLMKDIQLAVNILSEKIKFGKKIRVIGDYDIDGIQASYILVTALERVGAVVDLNIPDRMKDGYGINENLIEKAMDEGIDTILTCDNGISAIDPIAYAKSLGMTVIVTDHHDIPYMEDEEGKHYLHSEADAIINPKQEECGYPFTSLCGASVAYKLVEALYEHFGLSREETLPLLEFAAIATIGDVVDLTGENRIIVKYGLNLLRNTRNLGLKALIEINKIVPERLSSYHIGFVLGPCLNASGRLDTALRAFQLLRAKTKEEADTYAGDLKALNDSRKEMTLQGFQEGIRIIEEKDYNKDLVLVVYLPECHESLAGIIAGRIREKYNKPVFVLTKAEEGVKGSGRSIDAYHMYEELVKCKDILTKFGGHPLAAGLSLPEDKVDELRKRLNEQNELKEDDLISKIWIDIPLPFEYISYDLIKQLDLLEPFGKGNGKPVFAEKDVRLKRLFILGKDKKIVKMNVENNAGATMTCMYFGDADEFISFLKDRYGEDAIEQAKKGIVKEKIVFSILYYPDINEYNGVSSVQVIMQNYI